MRYRQTLALLFIGVGLGVGLGVHVLGCNGGTTAAPPEGDGATAPQDAAAADGGAGPRRPLRRYYMARTDKRCEVYSVEGDDISAPSFALCPASIEIGERIRLAGQSCFREGQPQREQPVPCPMELMLAEQQGRELEETRKAAEETRDAGKL